ncbi:MAG: hypothetical protein ACTSRZ_03470 [Promethearchaeota archaeon]
MVKNCPHCKREVKDTDKFCIFCGKPLISSISPRRNKNDKKNSDSINLPKDKSKDKSKEDKSISESNKGDIKKEEFIPFVGGSLEPVEKVSKSKKDKSKSESSDKKKIIPFTSDNFDTGEDNLELDEEIKEQLEIKMELALLDLKKVKLKSKLNEIMKDANSERYEMDLEFAQKVNAKLNAVKEIQKELKEKEEELKSKLDVFKIDELNNMIEERRAQLNELKRQYKFGKIKEAIFIQLKQEYAEDFREAQEQLEKIQKQIKIWISKLKTELNRNQVKLKTIEARYKTKEIDKERFESEKKDILKEIEILEKKIDTLRQYSTYKPKFL